MDVFVIKIPSKSYVIIHIHGCGYFDMVKFVKRGCSITRKETLEKGNFLGSSLTNVFETLNINNIIW